MTTYSKLDDAPDSVRAGTRAIKPEEAKLDLDEAHRILGRINHCLIKGDRFLHVSADLCEWLTARLLDAGWTVERSPLREDGTVHLLVTSEVVS